MINIWILVALILLVTAADAVRDATYGKSKVSRDAAWWRFHACKWIALYVPIIIILYQAYDQIGSFVWIIYLAIGGLVVWKLTARWAGASWLK